MIWTIHIMLLLPFLATQSTVSAIIIIYNYMFRSCVLCHVQVTCIVPGVLYHVQVMGHVCSRHVCSRHVCSGHMCAQVMCIVPCSGHVY